MWTDLWDKFEEKADRLIAGGEIKDAIDKTIMWQIKGKKKFVGHRIPPNLLQLPELYSGSPWKHRDRWIAFVTVNPSIHAYEVYPSRADRANCTDQELLQFFTERFQPNGPIAGPGTLIHGRNKKKVASWRNRKKRNNQKKHSPHGQATWTRIDNAVRKCLESAQPRQQIPDAPLGQTAAIIDIVPWKFQNWSAVHKATKAKLLELGKPYLTATLQEHTPAVIVAAGESVRRLMHDLHPNTIPAYERHRSKDKRHRPQRGFVKIGNTEVPWFGVAAPTAYRFSRQMRQIHPKILKLID